jgi:hypothetical protein
MMLWRRPGNLGGVGEEKEELGVHIYAPWRRLRGGAWKRRKPRNHGPRRAGLEDGPNIGLFGESY